MKTARIAYAQVASVLLLLMTVGAASNAAQAASQEGLVAYYAFDGDAHDQSGNGNDGIEHGDILYKQGVWGDAVSFDGSDDYIRVPSAATLNPSDQLSISFWINIEEVTNVWTPIIHKGGPHLTDSKNREYSVWLQNTFSYLLASAGDNSGQYYQFSCCASAEVWQHYVGVVDRQNHRMTTYLDGVLIASSEDPYVSFNNNNNDLLIGWSEETDSVYSPLKGRIDELRIYNRALSEQEIIALYTDARPVSTPHIITHDYGEGKYIPTQGSGIYGVSGNIDYVQVKKHGAPTFNDIFDFSDFTHIDSLKIHVTHRDNWNHWYGWGFGEIWRAKADSNAYTIGTLSKSDDWVTDRFDLSGYLETMNKKNPDGMGYDLSTFLLHFTEHTASLSYETPKEAFKLGKITFYVEGDRREGIGEIIKISPTLEFVLEQGDQEQASIELTNLTADRQTALLEVKNQNPDLAVSITRQNPIELAPGERVNIPVVIDADTTPPGVYASQLLQLRVAGDGTLYSNIKVTVTDHGSADLPDLGLAAQDIQLVDYTVDESIVLKIRIYNKGRSPAIDVPIRIYEFGTVVAETTIPKVPADGQAETTITLPSPPAGDRLFEAEIDPEGTIPERDTTNNKASRMVSLPGGTGEVMQGGIVVTGSLPSSVCANATFSVNAMAFYNISINGVRDRSYLVKGGSAAVTVSGKDTGETIYGGIYTDITGHLNRIMLAASTPGIYQVRIKVSDNTFIGIGNFVYTVAECPDGYYPPIFSPCKGCGEEADRSTFWRTAEGFFEWTCADNDDCPPWAAAKSTQDVLIHSEDIHFTNNHPAPGEEVTIFAEIHHFAPRTDMFVGDLPVNLSITTPGVSRDTILEMVIDRIPVGSAFVFANWEAPDNGIYLVEVEIDSSYSESNLKNNAATRAIVVGKLENGRGAIAGQVVNALEAVEGVPVGVSDSDGFLLGSSVTDATGFYLFERLPVGDIDVSIETPSGYQSDAEVKTATVADQEISTIDFYLSESPTPSDTEAPTLAPLGDITTPATSPAGAVVTYSASATDAVDGDLTPSCTPVAGSTFALGATPVTCTATDVAGNSASTSFLVTVFNQAPVADANGPYTVDEGGTVTLDASASSDLGNDTLTYAWDLDGDGQFDDGIGITIDFTGVDEGVQTVRMQVSDGALTDTASANVTVINLAPLVTPSADRTLTEGDSITVTATFTDPGVLDTHTATVSWGDGNPSVPTPTSESGGAGMVTSASHRYPDNGSYTVTVAVADNDGATGDAMLAITVHNANPIVQAGADQSVLLGQRVELDPTFTDPGVLDTHTASIDWGDGTVIPGLVTEVNGSGGVSASHGYASAGSHTVTITITDKDGGIGSDTLRVQADSATPVNQAPVAVLAPSYEQYQGLPLALDANDSYDPDSVPDRIISWVWDLNGDGAYDDASGERIDHTWNTAGTYPIGLMVTDTYGATGTTSSRATVDPLNCVSDLRARSKRTKIQINWTHVGAHHYNLYRATTSGGPYQRIGSTDSTYSVYTDSAVSVGTTYYYLVKQAEADETELCESNESSATPMRRPRR